MAETVLQLQNLSKKYGTMYALDHVSLELEAGKIYGLIGQNGAGKTTLMRMIAGLGFPTEGTVTLFGQSTEKGLQEERRRLGTMIEYPGLNPGMSAWENLHLQRITKGIPDRQLENKLLETVGLSDTGRKKVSGFSMGMKQRLGIALALTGNPEMLILDEPVNGLDPLGVVEIRKLLTSLCEERHVTILISSHNLPELYQLATDYLIIHQGALCRRLTHKQLDENCRKHLLIETDNAPLLVQVLESQLHTVNYQVLPGNTVKLYDYVSEPERVARVLQENGILTTGFTTAGDTLESYYISVIGGTQHV